MFHRDKDFRVEDGRLNVWVPLTNVWGEKIALDRKRDWREGLQTNNIKSGPGINI